MSRPSQLRLMTVPRKLPSSQPEPTGGHGVVFTRRWVVDLILDAVGYRSDSDLASVRIVEPACGCGAFIVPIVERLLESCALHGRDTSELADAIRAFDVLEHNAEYTRKAVLAKLLEAGEPLESATWLSREWIKTGDFLLADHDLGSADFVVGNPPYVRLEDVAPEVSEAYRAECPTMRGRSDLFVGFFEKGLSLLGPGGTLGFICADRWMRNQYGAKLRAFVTEDFAVDAVISMHDVDAFEDSVSAYPAVTVIRRAQQGPVRVVEAKDSFEEEASRLLTPWLVGGDGPAPQDIRFQGAELPTWFAGEGHWPAGSPHALELLALLESRHATLEDARTGTRVGIGVATGCDDVFIVDDASGVEPSRLLPLLETADISTGVPRWSGRSLVNPWDDGRLVELDDYPGLAKYLQSNAGRLRKRHVARKQPARWYRTIDRVTPGLQERPKLLLPDMKAAAHPVLDPGGFYPHHNLYYVVSDAWDLEVLGGLLLSDVANLFVGAYCVKMRGGTYRFQAQYLRKIRIPDRASLTSDISEHLRSAFRGRDRSMATEAAAEAYGITPGDLAAV